MALWHSQSDLANLLGVVVANCCFDANCRVHRYRYHGPGRYRERRVYRKGRRATRRDVLEARVDLQRAGHVVRLKASHKRLVRAGQKSAIKRCSRAVNLLTNVAKENRGVVGSGAPRSPRGEPPMGLRSPVVFNRDHHARVIVKAKGSARSRPTRARLRGKDKRWELVGVAVPRHPETVPQHLSRDRCRSFWQLVHDGESA